MVGHVIGTCSLKKTRPMMTATNTALQAGMTALGVAWSAFEMVTAKTALTISSSRKITIMNSVLARGLTTSPVRDPMDRA